MKKALIMCVALAAIVSLRSVQAQDYSGEPGYVDFSSLANFATNDDFVEVFLDQDLLAILGETVRDKDDELAEQIVKLKLIRINKFTAGENNQNDVIANVNKIDQQLKGKSWTSVVRVNSKDKFVRVLINRNGSTVNGVLVMAVEESKEVVFVNIVGEVDMRMIGKLGKKFDMNLPGELDK